MKKNVLLILMAFVPVCVFSQNVDYSVVTVPEESGIEFQKITTDNDYVCMPIVRRQTNGVDWVTNKIIGTSKDGENIAFISNRGGVTNIFVKSVKVSGSTVQRTNRRAVVDLSYSSDGKYITFSENVQNKNTIFQTDANSGFVCRQITSGNSDYSPVYTKDMTKIMFSRLETRGYSIWSYDMTNNFLSSYSAGMNPCPAQDNDEFFCVRNNGAGKGEIWRVHFSTGVEECIVADAVKSFSTPTLSPDGEWLLFVGSSPIPYGNGVFWNTDIYVCRTDGTRLTQLTFHAADDLSPEWSSDGRGIFFVSQRGSSEGTANVWRMPFIL